MLYDCGKQREHHVARSASAHIAVQEQRPPSAPAVSAGEAWRLVAPWLGYVFLGAAALLGLFTASGADDAATYASGLATFAVAASLIAWRMKRQLDGYEVGFLLPVAVSSSDALLVTIAVLGAMGLAGAVLAATVGGTVYGIGLALFIICAAFIFIEIKRYFDGRERGG
jgi:hypothetical protein